MNTEMSFILVQIREHESCWWFSENSERVDNHTLMCTELSLCLRDLCVYVPISEEKQLTQECLIQIDPAMIVKHTQVCHVSLLWDCKLRNRSL